VSWPPLCRGRLRAIMVSKTTQATGCTLRRSPALDDQGNFDAVASLSVLKGAHYLRIAVIGGPQRPRTRGEAVMDAPPRV
jgi:hypothetical protein